MRRDSTWSDERLAELAELPADHPDVQAVRRNPERWARLVALREFLAPGAEPEGARTGEAVTQIRAAVRSALDASAETTGAGRRPSPWFGGWQLAAAAVIVAVIAGVLLLGRQGDQSGTLRGPEDVSIETQSPVITDEGMRFSWRAIEGAEAYELRLLRADLGPAIPVITTQDTFIVVPPGEVAGGSGPAVHWRVSATRATRTIAESETERIPPP